MTEEEAQETCMKESVYPEHREALPLFQRQVFAAAPDDVVAGYLGSQAFAKAAAVFDGFAETLAAFLIGFGVMIATTFALPGGISGGRCSTIRWSG